MPAARRLITLFILLLRGQKHSKAFTSSMLWVASCLSQAQQHIKPTDTPDRRFQDSFKHVEIQNSEVVRRRRAVLLREDSSSRVSEPDSWLPCTQLFSDPRVA